MVKPTDFVIYPLYIVIIGIFFYTIYDKIIRPAIEDLKEGLEKRKENETKKLEELKWNGKK